MITTYIIIIIGVALIFDFVNGFHDAANSVATLVATKAFPHKFWAVLWAAGFNFLAYKAIGTSGVAKTIGKDIIESSAITPTVVLSGLLGAIVWNLYTWRKGIPSSSSHALMAGLAGAAIAYANSYTALKPDGWVLPLFFIIGAPLIGFCLSKLILWLVNGMLRRVNPKTVDKHARWFQFLSAAGFSYGHGMNDAQKTMGVITALLVSIGYLKDFSIPTWVVFSAHGAIALGTLCGGWRIVDTLAHKVAKKHMRPHEAFCAETSAALCIIPATLWKIPLSTTHTITGSIAGVGTAGGGLNNLYMRKLWEIFRAWILTLVVSSTLAAIFLYIFTSFGL